MAAESAHGDNFITWHIRQWMDDPAAATAKFYKHVGKFYSFYQFLAIGSHIFAQEPYLADVVFDAIIAIQSSAFMMTLVRNLCGELVTCLAD